MNRWSLLSTFVNMWYYILVFLSALLVDIIPFAGPPAWTVMVLLQTVYDLDIFAVLIYGVTGSTVGRYLYSLYIPYLSERILKKQKNDDIQYIGMKLGENSWKIQVFVFLYTLMPLPSTPLFTAAGIARIKPLHVLPAFFAGKFIIDAVMVLTGDYAAKNVAAFSEGLFSWQSISGTLTGVILVLVFLFIDWRMLLQYRKFKVKFNIWK
jgi:membrane protein DedA with SNARE-associated domain